MSRNLPVSTEERNKYLSRNFRCPGRIQRLQLPNISRNYYQMSQCSVLESVFGTWVTLFGTWLTVLRAWVDIQCFSRCSVLESVFVSSVTVIGACVGTQCLSQCSLLDSQCSVLESVFSSWVSVFGAWFPVFGAWVSVRCLSHSVPCYLSNFKISHLWIYFLLLLKYAPVCVLVEWQTFFGFLS